MERARCPECGYEVEIAPDIELGEIIVCDNCGADLIVATIKPVTLESFEEEEK